MKLGYIGLSNKGGALAWRPMREHQLRAFDLRPEILGRFAGAGAVPTQSAEALARESDMIMTCLPTLAEVRDVLFGDGLEDRLYLGEQLRRSADHDRNRPGIGAVRAAADRCVDH